VHEPAEWRIGHPAGVFTVATPVSQCFSSCALKNVGQVDKESLVVVGPPAASILGKNLFQLCDHLNHTLHTNQEFVAVFEETGCPLDLSIPSPIEEMVFPEGCTCAIEVERRACLRERVLDYCQPVAKLLRTRALETLQLHPPRMHDAAELPSKVCRQRNFANALQLSEIRVGELKPRSAFQNERIDDAHAAYAP
jgi:hypothetical protein